MRAVECSPFRAIAALTASPEVPNCAQSLATQFNTATWGLLKKHRPKFKLERLKFAKDA